MLRQNLTEPPMTTNLTQKSQLIKTMLFVELTPHLLAVIERVLGTVPAADDKPERFADLPKALRNELQDYTGPSTPPVPPADADVEVATSTSRKQNGIPVEIVLQLSNYLKTKHIDDAYLHNLLRETRIVFETPQPKRTAPELEERRHRLRVDFANKEYQRMVANVMPGAGTSSSLMNDIREVRAESKQVTAVLNLLFSVIGVFAAAYVASGAAFTSIQHRVLFAFFAALVTAIAEAWLFVRYVYAPEQRKAKTETAGPRSSRQLEPVAGDAATEPLLLDGGGSAATEAIELLPLSET